MCNKPKLGNVVSAWIAYQITRLVGFWILMLVVSDMNWEQCALGSVTIIACCEIAKSFWKWKKIQRLRRA